MSDTQVAQLFPARLIPEPETRATVAQLLALAQSQALDPIIFDAERLSTFFWTAEISSSRPAACFTRRATGSLKNCADDAKNGIPFQDSHMTDGVQRMFGQLLGARYFDPATSSAPRGSRRSRPTATRCSAWTPRSTPMSIRCAWDQRSYQHRLPRWHTYRHSLCARDIRDYTDGQNYCPH